MRVVEPVIIDGLPEDAPELVLSRLLDEYRNLRDRRFQTATPRGRAAAGLLVIGLQQRLLSSIEAFAVSLSAASQDGGASLAPKAKAPARRRVAED